MKLYEKIFKHFGGVPATAKALKVSHQYIYHWKGHIPYNSARKIERLSKGVFTVTAIMNANKKVKTR